MDMPAVRQDPKTGSVAVKLPPGSSLGDWGIMTPDRGGSFATTEQVKDWVVLINPGLAIESTQ